MKSAKMISMQTSEMGATLVSLFIFCVAIYYNLKVFNSSRVIFSFFTEIQTNTTWLCEIFWCYDVTDESW